MYSTFFKKCFRRLKKDSRNLENGGKRQRRVIELSRRNIIFERTMIRNKSAEHVKSRGHEGDTRAIRFFSKCNLAPKAQKTLYSTMFLNTPDSQKSLQYRGETRFLKERRSATNPQNMSSLEAARGTQGQSDFSQSVTWPRKHRKHCILQCF